MCKQQNNTSKVTHVNIISETHTIYQSLWQPDWYLNTCLVINRGAKRRFRNLLADCSAYVWANGAGPMLHIKQVCWQLTHTRSLFPITHKHHYQMKHQIQIYQQLFSFPKTLNGSVCFYSMLIHHNMQTTPVTRSKTTKSFLIIKLFNGSHIFYH